MKRVLVLGGGFGGLAASASLRAAFDQSELEIVLADHATHFAMGFHKVSWIVGREQPGDGLVPLQRLESKGIRFVNAAVDSIEPAARAAVVGGERIEADALVVALGAEVAAPAIPGLAEHGISIYERDGATRAAEAFANADGCRIAIGVFGAPYKCPPAPFELALLASDAAATAGKRMTFVVFSPLPMSIPALGPQGCNPLESRLAMLDIEFRANTKATAVEEGRVVVDGADPVEFDLLFAVAPHRVPFVLVDAGLAQAGGWVKVDPATLETGTDGVYAVGDCTAIPLSNGQALPKAGAIAEDEALVVAARIAARLRGEEPAATFEGRAGCYLEVGGGEAMMVEGNFYADPPDVQLTTPSREQLAQKHEWERERLAAWLG